MHDGPWVKWKSLCCKLACSLDLISQPFSSVFLSQQISINQNQPASQKLSSEHDVNVMDELGQRLRISSSSAYIVRQSANPTL
jgi:hypothetical protein